MKVIRSQIVEFSMKFRNRKKFAHHHRVARIVYAMMLTSMPYVVAYQALWAYHLNVALNVLFQVNAHQLKHVSIKNALIHVSVLAE